MLHWSLKNGVFASYSPPALLELSPTDFKNQTLWGLIFPVQFLRVGMPYVGPDLLCPQRCPLCLWYPPCLWLITPGDLAWFASLLLLSFPMWLLLYVISCGRCYSPVFRSFSKYVALHIVTGLVCTWREVSSGSSHLTIFLAISGSLLELLTSI